MVRQQRAAYHRPDRRAYACPPAVVLVLLAGPIRPEMRAASPVTKRGHGGIILSLRAFWEVLVVRSLMVLTIGSRMITEFICMTPR